MNDLIEIILITLACPLVLPIVIEEQEKRQKDKEIGNERDIWNRRKCL